MNMRIIYKGKTMRVQEMKPLGSKISILGFWEDENGNIPKNSHVHHLLLDKSEFTQL